MADMSSDATAGRCRVNAELSASVTDAGQLLSYYEKWSNMYDEDFRSEHYVGPRLVADAVCELIPAERRGQVCVLDAAAGTGLVGLELSKNGFKEIHAIDASDAMLGNLRQKGIYTKTFKAMFGNDSIEMKEEYDVVTLSGGFVPGHVPMTALNDFIQMCKPGGIITIVMRYEYLHVCPDYQQMEQLMKDLEHQSKKWKQIKRQITPNYLLDKEGITFVFQKV